MPTSPSSSRRRSCGQLGAFDQQLGIEDIEATIHATRKMVGGGKVGAVGYCLGGRLAYMTAARTDINASVGYYGVGIDGLLGESHGDRASAHAPYRRRRRFRQAPTSRGASMKELDSHPKVTIFDYPGLDFPWLRRADGQPPQRRRRAARRRPDRDLLRPASEMSGYRLVAREFGGPEVITREPLVAGAVAPGMARVRHSAIGVNYIDTYHRSGLYPQPLPAPMGVEAAGVIEALGDGVTGLSRGQRVAYASAQPGQLCELAGHRRRPPAVRAARQHKR